MKRLLAALALLTFLPVAHAAQQILYCDAATQTACNTTSNAGNSTSPVGDAAWLMAGKTNANFDTLAGFGLFGTSETANEFLASPSAAAGAIALRKMTIADLLAGPLPALSSGKCLSNDGSALTWTTCGTGSGNVSTSGTISQYGLPYWATATSIASLLPGATGDYILDWSSLTAAPSLAALGTGVGAALAIAVGSTGGPVVLNGAGGTPSSINLSNAAALTLPVGSINASGTASSTTFLEGDGKWAAPTAAASSITPGTTTVSGATAPCLIENSTSTTMACPGTLPAAIEPAHTGDVTNTAGSLAMTVAKVNGGSVPASAGCVSTNSSSQFVSGCSQSINAQTATTYTVLSTDAGKLITFSNASSVAVTLPAATGTGFGSGFAFTVQNLGAGIVTITPTTSTINGAATLTIPTNMGCGIVSDGTNYQVGSCGALQAQVSAQSSGISVTPSCAYRVNTVTSTAYTIAAPTAGSATTSTTGGTALAASTTYYVAVTATTASGETVLGTVENVTTGTGSTNTVTANWTDVTGATGYNVYISTSTITGGEATVAYQTATSAATSSTFTAVPGTTQTTPSSNTSGKFTVNTPTGCTPTDGQKLILIVKSASGGTLSYSATGYITGSTTGAWPTNSGAASDDDHFALIYDGYAATAGWALDGYNVGIP